MGLRRRPCEEPTWQTFRRYADAVRGAGGDPVLISPEADASERARAFAAMDGLLLPGGADLDPRRYGEEPLPTTQVESGRDELEADAWQAARDRGLPVLGVCRGMQAINVFSGGSLVQHVDGHDSPPFPSPEARPHPMRIIGTSRLAGILGMADREVIEVNSYHHQVVRPDQLGDGLAVSATARGRRAGRGHRGCQIRTPGSSASRTTRSAPSSRRRSSPACGRRSSRRRPSAEAARSGRRRRS